RVVEHLRGPRAKFVQRLGGKGFLFRGEQGVECRGCDFRCCDGPQRPQVLFEETAERRRAKVSAFVLPPVVEQRAESNPGDLVGERIQPEPLPLSLLLELGQETVAFALRDRFELVLPLCCGAGYGRTQLQSLLPLLTGPIGPLDEPAAILALRY